MKKLELLDRHSIYIDEKYYEGVITEFDQVIVIANLYECNVSIECYENRVEKDYFTNRSIEDTMHKLCLLENEGVKIFTITYPKKEFRKGRRSSWIMLYYNLEDKMISGICSNIVSAGKKPVIIEDDMYRGEKVEEKLIEYLIEIKELL